MRVRQYSARGGTATEADSEIDCNFFTAKEEHTIRTMMPRLLGALK